MSGPETGADSELEADLAPYDYTLPPERIAQHALAERDAAKLLVLSRSAPDADFRHASVRDLPTLLRQGDLLVVNTTRVLPAKLIGQRDSGGAVEALILSAAAGEPGRFRALLKMSRRARAGIGLCFEGDDGTRLAAEIVAVHDRGEVTLAFAADASPYSVGRAPLPPYIRRERNAAPSEDLDRYQTVFARVPGAIAAPTAGLHLTSSLLGSLEDAGVARAEVVLHVGAGTFRPLQPEDLASGKLHAEPFELPPETAAAVAATRDRGGRVVAVGTTVARVLESCAGAGGTVEARSGTTRLFLRPGSPFGVVDALLTNFHLPRSSLLLLVAAFAGRDRVMAAYRLALAREYRFYSYGDAMLIL